MLRFSPRLLSVFSRSLFWFSVAFSWHSINGWRLSNVIWPNINTGPMRIYIHTYVLCILERRKKRSAHTSNQGGENAMQCWAKRNPPRDMVGECRGFPWKQNQKLTIRPRDSGNNSKLYGRHMQLVAEYLCESICKLLGGSEAKLRNYVARSLVNMV